MATRYKSINKLVKFLAVLLSVVLMAGAALCAVRFVAALEYTGNVKSLFGYDVKSDLAECEPLVDALTEDINALGTLTYIKDEKGIEAALLSQKEDFLNTMIERFMKQKAEYSTALNSDEDAEPEYYDEDGDPVYGESTTLDYSEIEELFDYSYSFRYNNAYTLTLSTEVMDGNTGGAYRIDFLKDDEASARKKLEEMFNTYVQKKYYTENFQHELFVANNMQTDLCYYVVNRNNGVVVSNISEENAKQVLAQKYGIMIKNKTASYSDGLKGVLDNFNNAQTNTLDIYDYECDYYLTFDTQMSDEEAGAHSFRTILRENKKASGYNVTYLIIGAVVMFILSVALAVWYFVNAGTRDESGRVKLAFIDKVPCDLHLAVNGGLIAFLVWIVASVYEGIEFSVYSTKLENLLTVTLVLSFVAVVWALFIEFVSSFIRVCKSDTKVYKHQLVYYICKYIIFVPCVWLFKQIKKIFKKLLKLFTYKPGSFKRILTRYLILYLGVNFLIFMIMLFAMGDGDFPGIIFGAGFFALLYNTAIIAYGVWYAVQLDRIITAAHNRTEPQVNFDKLPQSLKTLADSIRVSRDELSVAISKAVRDERMRAELITNVSHDLKTPLTSIISYVDLLKGCEIESDDAREYIGVLDEKSSRLKRLIDDLIEASKITSGVISINPVQLSLSELAAQAVYERQQEFLDNNLELVFKGDKTNVTCFADGNKAFRVFDNLLSNAKKYSARGTRVYCDVYEENGMSVFELKNISSAPLDISPEELTERFVRGDKSRTQDGNGLGLSIADSLCTAMNGRLIISIDGDLFKARVLLPKE